ncbi:MAG: LytTR family DNA-binding domain-containing protein [Candidatus Izemoplasmatales bacterium]
MQIISAHKVEYKVIITTSENCFDIGQTLSNLEQMLGHPFFRIRNNVIINLYRIKYFNKDKNKVIMDNESFFVVAKRRKNEFLKIINNYTFEKVG